MAQPTPGYFPPSPAPKGKVPGWAIPVVVVGILVVLACLGGATGVLLKRMNEEDTTRQVAGGLGSGNGPRPSASPVPLVPERPPPADKTYSGRGSKTISISLDEDYLHIVKITHDGTSNFMVDSMDADGDQVGFLVNEVGDFTGVRLLDIDRGIPARLKIRADGRWTVTVMVSDKAPRWTGKASGRGDAILRVNPDSDDVRVRFTHKGQDNTTLSILGKNTSDLLVNEIGRYSGEMVIPRGTTFIDITGNGAWTLVKV